MKQIACGAPPVQLQAGTSGGPSCRAPLTAAPLLAQGQWRRSERSVAAHARRPAAVGSGVSGSGAAPHKLLTPEPHQQHAQPPRAGAQQQQQPQAGVSLQSSPPPPPPQQLPRQQRIRAAAAEQPGPTGSGAPGDGGGGPSGAAPTPAAVAAGEGSTQLIFRFERRGDGWGEEILPHLVVEQRPLEKRKKRAYSRPDPWKDGSLECYLVDLGVPPDDVDRVVTQAVAWRVTPGGRSLIDRRRRSRVERNVRLVVEHLELECGVPFGPNGIAAILARCPEIMLCKPTTNDRWDRRAVELSAYLLRNGHCNVPEDWSENPELGLWVKRQRIARAAGQLSDERLSILQSMGFAFGEVAQLTEEWEHRFDQLVDWMLWHNENQQPFSWLGIDWGARGGITARELALWTTLQREYRARGLLPGEALSRFEAIGVQWDNAQDGSPAERRWMAWLGRLLYLIERHNTLLQQPRRGQVLNGRPKMGRPRGGSGGGAAAAAAGGRSGASGGGGEGEEGTLASSGGGGSDLAEDSDDEEGEPPLGPGGRRGSTAVAAARQRLQEEMAARRAALAAADLRSEPGLRFWLERQRRRWRRQDLPAELGLMLQLAGVQLDCYSPVEWQAVAHTAAGVLQGSQVTLDLAGAAQRARQAQLARQASSEPAAAATKQGAAAEAAADGQPDSQQRQQQQQQQQQQQPGARGQRQQRGAQLEAQRWPAGSVRMRVARWVQTQQALFAEGKLSAAQLRYMAFLGITWVLSDEVTHMGEATWRQWGQRLTATPRPLPRRGELWQWLEHQKGLHALGWLPPQRRRALEAAQVQLAVFDRCPEDAEWDLRLSQLLAYKAEHGHCRLRAPPADGSHAPGAEAAPQQRQQQQGEDGQQQQQQQQQQQRWMGLAAWLAEQHRLAAAGRLPAQRVAQLVAIGAAPAVARAPAHASVPAAASSA